MNSHEWLTMYVRSRQKESAVRCLSGQLSFLTELKDLKEHGDLTAGDTGQQLHQLCHR